MFVKKKKISLIPCLSTAKVFSIWQFENKKNVLSITLSSIDPNISSSGKDCKFSSLFPKRDEGLRGLTAEKGERKGERTRGVGCIGTSLSGSWRPSCGSCLAGRLFPGVEVRTGQEESSASNITPPAARRNVRTCDLSRNLARRTRRLWGIIASENGAGREATGART